MDEDIKLMVGVFIALHFLLVFVWLRELFLYLISKASGSYFVIGKLASVFSYLILIIWAIVTVLVLGNFIANLL